MEKINIRKTTFAAGDDYVMIKTAPNVARYLKTFEADEISVSIGPAETKRSGAQNAKLWALIGEMDTALNGRRSRDGENALYMNLIQDANIKTVLISIADEAFDEFKARGAFRVVEPLEQGAGVTLCRCYFGSSLFNTKEMADFIETALDYAAELGIDLTDYEELKYLGGS